MSTSIIDPTLPLQQIIPAYVYQQYADDADVVAFFNALNNSAQGYLEWFNQTPLGVYTSPNISGQLLDLIGTYLYGVQRPVFSTLSTTFVSDATNVLPTNTIATDGSLSTSSGTAIIATDDYYKRTLTWCSYLGDGRFFNFSTLRKRVARFLYGLNGGDVTVTQSQNVSLAVGSSPNYVTITIPTSVAANYFEEGLAAGTLPFPFQLIPTVVLT